MTEVGNDGGIDGNVDEVIIDCKKFYKNLIDLVANYKLRFVQ